MPLSLIRVEMRMRAHRPSSDTRTSGHVIVAYLLLGNVRLLTEGERWLFIYFYGSLFVEVYQRRRAALDGDSVWLL